MRFIGGKSLLLDDIGKAVGRAETVIDLFSGSGAVAARLAADGRAVTCNDQMYFSYVLLRGTVQIGAEPEFKAFGDSDPISALNGVDPGKFDEEKCFIYRNYSPNGDCRRMYFTQENALKIDAVRQTIEKWRKEELLTEDEYFYLLASLISAVPSISNVAGVYGAYLKKWDRRALNPLILEKPVLRGGSGTAKAFNMKANDLLRSAKADVLYSDSPYNGREYLPNYHVLETIARYDYPEIRGVTGMRDYSEQKSDFCSKAKAPRAFETMFRLADVKRIVVSYSSEGIVPTDEMLRICSKYAEPGSLELREIPYRRYKSRIPNDEEGLAEQIYSFRKRRNPYDKSPMNYVGGKHRLLPRLMRLFPDDVGTAVDLFCGGCDVAANLLADRIIANDANRPLMEMYEKFRRIGGEAAVREVEEIVERYGLSKTNEEGYLRLRADYNASEERNPSELFALVCFSYNHQIRFNSRLEYNNPFGRNRSSFTKAMRENLIRFCGNVRNVEFSALDFRRIDLSGLEKRDFIYADPPYLITTGSYNDGKRGYGGWSGKDDADLFALLDEADARGVRFALSNALSAGGAVNGPLAEWAKKYEIHHLKADYSNSGYNKKDRTSPTDEVLITNCRFPRS